MASAKKGKKAKGKKTSSLSLQDFLQTTVPPGMAAVPAKVMNWADECEDDDFSGPRPLMALPTAPRAARILNDDTIPTQPPFNAFLSNLPYDIKEDDLREFFDSLDIATKSIRLPSGSDSGGGRVSRGIGYVEYSSRDDMIEAISLPDPMLRNRRIRIDVSNPNEQKDRGPERNRRYGNNEDRPERPIDTNWRQRAEKSPDRNGAPEPPRENRRGFGGGFGRDRMRDSSPRADDGSSWRSERKPDPSPPRRREFDRDDRNRNRRGYEEPRGGLMRGDRQRSPEQVRERPKLTLAPRTLPIEELPRPPPEVEREKVESADEEPERPKPTPVPAAKVFGEAKPVDTLAKEQEIEARRLEKIRLAKEKEQEEREAREREQEAARQLEREQRDKELAEREKHVGETQEKEDHVDATSNDENREPQKKKEEVNWRKMCEDREKNKDQQADNTNGRRALSPRHSKRYSPDRRDMGPKRSMNVERRVGTGGVYRDAGRPRDDRPRDGGRHRDADMERRNNYNDGQRRGSDRSRDNLEIKRKDPPAKKEYIERDMTLDDLPKLQQSTGPNFSVSNAFAELIDENEEEA